MGDLFSWWIGGGDWYDLQQRRRMDDIEATHRASETAMRRQMERTTTSLATRVDQLENALLAVVELEDTRELLTEHADAAATRRFAREVVAALPAIRTPGASAPSIPAPPADVPGYWLHPASLALANDLQSGTADRDALLAEARRRDAFQTDQTIVCLAAMTGRPEQAEAVLPSLYPSTDRVTDDELVIWRAVATGRFGDRARAGLVDALRQALPTQSTLIADLERIALGSRRESDLPAVQAGRELEALHGWVDAIVTAPASQTSAASAADNALADQLALLITRGAPGEENILRRMVQIRGALSAIGVGDGPALPPTPDHTAVGSVREILLGDLELKQSGPRWRFQMLGGDSPEPKSEPDPEQRRIALAAVAPAVEQLAGRLAAQARSAPAQSVEVNLGSGVDVTVTPAGPTTSAWQKRTVTTLPAPAWRRPTVIGLGVATVAFAALAVVSPAFIALAVITAVVAGVLLYQDRQEAGRARDAATAQAQNAERKINDARDRLHQGMRDSAAAAEASEAHHRAILEALRANGGDGGRDLGEVASV